MCISALVSPVIQRNLLLWKLLKGEGFPTVWQHCQLISLDNILPITTIHKSVLFFIPRWSCNVPSNVGTTSCDLWESLGRGAYSQAYAGSLCDTRASQHHVWGFSPKLEILPNRETGWVEHSWNFFYFLIKRNKSHWNFLNINLSCQRIYLNIEWNLTISVKKPSTLIDLYYHHLHINHKNSMKKKIKFCLLHFCLPCEYCGSTVIRAPPAWWLWLVVGIVLFSCFILKTQFQFGWNSVDKDTKHSLFHVRNIYC